MAALVPPVALRRIDAAEFVGLSLSAFDRAVKSGIFRPNRVGSYNVADLTAALQCANDNGDTEEGRQVDEQGQAPRDEQGDLRLRIDAGALGVGPKGQAQPRRYDDMVSESRSDAA